jgi:hypothetical protein
MLQRRRFLIAAFACAALPRQVLAQVKIEGLTFPATLRLADTELVLNGVGLRAVAWFKGYAAGLYLPARAATPALVLAGTGPKRLQLRLLQDVPAAEFVKAIDKGFVRNTPAAQQPALAERRQQFDAQVQALVEVKKGDVVDLDFLPARGLVFSHNGQPRGEAIAGDDFYAALLRIFIGEHPVDDRLKAGLLGGRAP